MERFSLDKKETYSRRGFNLVEAAIVLGVVGLVIGGIWTASSMVRQNMRVNTITSSIATIVGNTRNLFPLSTYPASGFANITAAAYYAGVFPSDFTLGSTSVTSPDGIVYVLQTSCNGSGLCPAIALQIFLRYSTGAAYKNSIDAAECRQISSRVTSRGGVLRIFVTKPGGMTSTPYTPPFDPATFVCDSTDGYIDMRFPS